MGASIRIEIFPADIDRFLDFYTRVLRFNVMKREGQYVSIKRDSISIGANCEHAEGGMPDSLAFGRPVQGVEIVFEVDDLKEERDHVVASGWKLDADVTHQFWGLNDFRIFDPDGYYLRITDRGAGQTAAESNNGE